MTLEHGWKNGSPLFTEGLCGLWCQCQPVQPGSYVLVDVVLAVGSSQPVLGSAVLCLYTQLAAWCAGKVGELSNPLALPEIS